MVNALIEMALRGQEAAFGESLRAWRRLLSLPRVADRVRATAVGTTAHEVVHEGGPARLLRYRRGAPTAYAQPILVCPALIRRPYLLDLQPDRSVVLQFLDRGFEVFLIDWGVPSAADRGLTPRDYVCGLLKDAVDHVVARASTPDLHLFGYGLGGTLATMFTTIYPELVHTLTLMAAPLDFAAGAGGLLRAWADRRYFDVDALVDAFGNIPAPLLQLPFRMASPVEGCVERYIRFHDRMDDEWYVGHFCAVEKWLSDAAPVAGETFRDLVAKLYQRNELVEGKLRLGDVPVRLGRIVCPLLLLTAGGDRLVPPAQTLGITPHVATKDIASRTFDGGHLDLAVSSRAHSRFWPEATKWIADRSTRAVLAWRGRVA